MLVERAVARAWTSLSVSFSYFSPLNFSFLYGRPMGLGERGYQNLWLEFDPAQDDLSRISNEELGLTFIFILQ